VKIQRLLIVISLVDRSLAFEWFFRELSKTKIVFQVVFLHPHEPALAKFCKSLSIPVHYIHYQDKKNAPIAFFKIFWLMIINRINIVHAHLFDASLIAIAASRLAGIQKRINTRHHASQHHIYNPHAVKFDRFINQHSTHIIAISEGIKQILIEKEGVATNKITVVHHGFDLNYFEQISMERLNTLKEKYLLGAAQPIIGVIARWTHWKGIQFIIPAFKELLQHHPSAILLLANATGEYVAEIETLLTQIPNERYRKISFEADTPALYHLMNVFVHVPIDDHSEAFGQVYVEALAAGIPCVFTLSGIANTFISDYRNALIVPYQNITTITQAINKILNDERLKNKLVETGKGDVANLFDIALMIQKTQRVYEQ